MFSTDDMMTLIMKYNAKRSVDQHDGGIPNHMQTDLAKYLSQGARPGDFLLCVLKNDLFGALAWADTANIGRLREYMYFLCEHAPPTAFGDHRSVEGWIATGGFLGLGEKPRPIDTGAKSV